MNHRFRSAALGGIASAVWAAATAAPAGPGGCRLLPDLLERGEERDVLLCGAGLAGPVTLGGMDGTGLEVVYQQPLRACAPGSREPGLHLVLRAGPTATSADLQALGADGQAACAPAPRLTVPGRVALGAVALRPARRQRTFRLDLRAPAGVDFSGSCDRPWTFDRAEGPALELAAPPRCARHRIEAILRAGGGQLQPARLVLPLAGSAGAREGVALVRLPDPAWRAAMPPSAARFVDVDGIRTRYFESGRGSPLVLVHGGQAGGENNHAEVWLQNLRGLSAHFRVIALDRLAQGATANLADAADYARYYERDAGHLHGFLRALGLRDVTLVGHSQGGYPVTAVALDHPELVRCLVNVDSVMVPDDPEPMKQALGFIAYIATALNPPSGPTFYSARRGIRLRAPSGNNIADDEARRIVAQFEDPKTREARSRMAAERMTPLHPAFKALRDAALRRIRAGALQAPSLVYWGADDPQVPLALGLQLYEALRAGPAPAALHVIDDAGHFPFAEHPAEFDRAVSAFCGR